MAGKKDLERLRRRRRRKQRIIRATVHLFVWLGMAVLYYVGFSVFFDTPFEYQMKHSTDRLRREYEALSARYDSLSTVLGNLSERDRNVFRILFESEPYDFDSEHEQRQSSTYEKIVGRSTRQLKRELRERVSEMERQLETLNASYLELQARIDTAGRRCDNIPSIQPVINKQLTLLTASYGMRIHPFYKTLQSHQGVDYTIPEGSRVFATADGVVRDAAQRNSTQGQTVVIDHGNGYETSYSHLSKINVRKGQTVRRGDIIALSGDTGLSLAPHLHYEVRLDGMRVDPQIRMLYLMLILGFLGWPGIARLVRGQILSLREQEFMTATEACGISVSRRIFRHLIPNVIPQLIVTCTMSLGSTILTEATLSFLGLGVKYPFASWGNIINDVNNAYVMTNYLFIWIPAGVCLLLTVLGFNFVGDGLRDAFDPKMKR